MAFLFAIIAGLTSGWTGFGFAVRAAAIFTIISWIFITVLVNFRLRCWAACVEVPCFGCIFRLLGREITSIFPLFAAGFIAFN